MAAASHILPTNELVSVRRTFACTFISNYIFSASGISRVTQYSYKGFSAFIFTKVTYIIYLNNVSISNNSSRVLDVKNASMVSATIRPLSYI